MNETLEFIRILLYFLGVYGLIHLGVTVKDTALSLYAVSLTLFVRGWLLFFQINSPDNYRELSNTVSTPSVVIAVVLIYINLWKIRRK